MVLTNWTVMERIRNNVHMVQVVHENWLQTGPIGQC
jgi:hypothetical protein